MTKDSLLVCMELISQVRIDPATADAELILKRVRTARQEIETELKAYSATGKS